MGQPRPVTPLGLAAAALERVRAGLVGADVDPLVGADLDEAMRLVGGLDAYVEGCTTPDSEPLRHLAAATAAQDWDRPGGTGPGGTGPGGTGPGGTVALEQEMLSGHVEGRFLEFLVHVSGARRVLEVGLFTGYSALAMAEALGDGGRVVACELDPGVADLARGLLDESPVGDRVEIEVGPAADTLAVLAERGEVFDVVFVDADKPGYAGYLDALLDGPLLAPGGFVAVDNTLLQGEPWAPASARSANGEAIAAFNARVAADPRVVQVLVPLRDGVTLLRRA